MWLKRGLSLLVPVVALLPLGAAAPMPVQTTLARIPKAYQQTWYHYDENGQFDTVKFTAKSFRSQVKTGTLPMTDTMQLHVHQLNSSFISRRSHPSWGAAQFDRQHRLRLTGWNQPAGTGASYQVSVKTFHQQQLVVLSQSNAIGTWVYEHYFQSKALAKLVGNAHFPGEVYATSY
ncbi:hypothetical protein ACFP1L_13790 [Lactiplantibacillus nangangensis]|uniref:Uncharacterized protein n=1 Tax=Lactiplantibacillus nangangensis TaxID=2559917 RepID=A0ABW1SMJ6_9LACO|nr:hypothetical protein [Lactiplantibacillus nangangensis]